MDFEAFLVILSRWVHIVTACISLGGVFFIRIIVPIGLKSIESPEQRTATFLKMRRVFKMVIHTAIVLFLASGIYNTTRNWHAYAQDRAVMHALWGTHMLLALVVFSIALYVLAGKEPPANHKTLTLVNLILLLIIIALASTLKTVRERLTTRPVGAMLTEAPAPK